MSQGPENMQISFDFEPKDIVISNHETVTVFLASIFEYLLSSGVEPAEIGDYLIGIIETTQINFERYQDATNEVESNEDSNA